jgi:hypothetical protein
MSPVYNNIIFKIFFLYVSLISHYAILPDPCTKFQIADAHTQFRQDELM